MKKISGIEELKNILIQQEKVWLLLYKSGSEQSDCAGDNFEKAIVSGSDALCVTDVNLVKDIHPEYGVTSVPSLLQFENGVLKNVIKGCHTKEQFSSIVTKTVSATNTVVEEKRQKRVTVYTTPTCSWCNTIKRYFKETGIQYREVNVAADQKAAEEMVRKSGQQGVPQTEIDGQIVVGFDKARINTLLGIR
jgi:glutaredoxin-like YruB-family protein